VHVVPHGVFTHLRRLAGGRLPEPLSEADAPVVLFFGLLRPYKGLDTLLAAWRGIDGAELWIVGRPRMPIDPLRASAPEGVRFVTRFVSDAELAACFARAHIVVLPYSETERIDQSGVLATALAFGRPVVASDIGGFSEVAALGAARLVSPGDAVALRAALAQLLEHPDERRALASAARAAADGPLSWTAAADRTLAVYRRLLGQSPQSPS
jgi:glycosyltransferase involved in cell wall biosynthesis